MKVIVAPNFGGSTRKRQSLAPKPNRGPLVRAGGKVQGTVVEEAGQRIFVRRVTWARHFFRAADGWSLSGPILSQLRHYGVTFLRYRDDTGGTWEVSLSLFLQRATQRSYGEEQFILPRQYWGHSLPTAEAEQTGLFLAGV